MNRCAGRRELNPAKSESRQAVRLAPCARRLPVHFAQLIPREYSTVFFDNLGIIKPHQLRAEINILVGTAFRQCIVERLNGTGIERQHAS